MHTFPAWKIWLVFTVLALALVLALPNFFGDAAALQLSRNDRTAATEAGRQQVVSSLQAQGVTPESSFLESDRLVLRFHDVDAQLKARDLLQTGVGNEYLVALSRVPRTPAWIRAVGLKPMSLGLDLRGGVYFLYEVDVKGAVTQLLGSMERDYRVLLRKERIPFTAISNDGEDTVRDAAAQAGPQ
jgi:preprotein translocase subunit SecD